MVSPVFGLRPVRAARSRTKNVEAYQGNRLSILE